MELRQSELLTNTIVTRYSHCYFRLRLDRKTCYLISILLIEPKTIFIYRDLWFLKKFFFSIIFGCRDILYNTS